MSFADSSAREELGLHNDEEDWSAARRYTPESRDGARSGSNRRARPPMQHQQQRQPPNTARATEIARETARISQESEEIATATLITLEQQKEQGNRIEKQQTQMNEALTTVCTLFKRMGMTYRFFLKMVDDVCCTHSGCYQPDSLPLKCASCIVCSSTCLLW